MTYEELQLELRIMGIENDQQEEQFLATHPHLVGKPTFFTERRQVLDELHEALWRLQDLDE